MPRAVCLQFDGVLRQFRSQTHMRSPPTWGRDIVRENIRWAAKSRGEVGRWLRQRAEREDELELELRGASSAAP